MELIKPGIEINFVRWRLVFLLVSSGLFFLAIVSFIVPGPNWGIDFKGGTELRVRFFQPVEIGELRAVLSDLGLGEIQIQSLRGKSFEQEGGYQDYLVRAEEAKGKAGSEKVQASTLIEEKLEEKFGAKSFQILDVEYVGPRVGKELQEKGIQAMIYALIGILLYVGIRFEFRYAFGAVLALIHDTVITAGIYVLFQREWSLAIIAALLTIIGYSVNDTIVVYDRIRENIRRGRVGDFPRLVNHSINQTLSRTVLTSLTTLMAVVFLYIFGGGVIRDFSLVLIIGIVVGTYSSIYVASSLVIFLQELRGAKSTPAKGKK